MWASKTKTAIKHENNPQPDKEGRRSERQATRRTAYWLAQMPTNEPSIGSYRGTEYLDEPSCTTSKHNTPDRDDPVNPLRCLLVLGSAHISVRVPCRRTVFLRRPVVYPSSGVHGPLRCKLLIASLICIVVPVAGSYIASRNSPVPLCVSCALSTTLVRIMRRLVRLSRRKPSSCQTGAPTVLAIGLSHHRALSGGGLASLSLRPATGKTPYTV